MAVPVVVPDASVILKWVLPAADDLELEPALALRDAITAREVQAYVPTLWLYEVGNTLARRFPDRAGRALDVLLRFGLVSAPRSPKWLNTVLELTGRYGVTFYDATYHAHAIVRRGAFVTADKRYLAKAGEAGHAVTLQELAALLP